MENAVALNAKIPANRLKFSKFPIKIIHPDHLNS